MNSSHDEGISNPLQQDDSETLNNNIREASADDDVEAGTRTKRIKLDNEEAVPSGPNNENNEQIKEEHNSDVGGYTIAEHDFDDYNEESDQDWEDTPGSDSDISDIGPDLIHDALFYEEEDEEKGEDEEDEDIYAPQWESFTEEEAEHIREESRELGLMKFLEKYLALESVPVPKLLEVFGISLGLRATMLVNDLQLVEILRSVVVRFLRKRKRLEMVNTLEDVVHLISTAQKVMFVTGAGVSVSCGIPDFRSETGIYSRLQEYDLSDPQEMFDISYFRERPEIFYSFAKELYPSKYEPSPSHIFVKLMEEKGKLLRDYTQNIDTLEHKAGIKRVVNCHGSFATASCVTCRYQCDGSAIEDYICSQKVPPCPQCGSLNTPIKKKAKNNDDDDESDTSEPRGVSIMKPDITFFGESLPAEFDRLLPLDTKEVDLLIVMGSSLKVSPVSEIMTQIPHHIPQILINRTPITHLTFDIQLLGYSDDIVTELCRMLEWDLRHEKLPGGSALSEESRKLSREGPGDLVEIIDPETNQVKHTESKVWKFIQNGLYAFNGAVLDQKFHNAHRCDERGSRDDGSDNGDDIVPLDPSHTTIVTTSSSEKGAHTNEDAISSSTYIQHT